ncbi:hypothetical protein MMC22_006437 [Lobaria immixta]|nr:hypothetical protein [Lobaria immixta]
MSPTVRIDVKVMKLGFKIVELALQVEEIAPVEGAKTTVSANFSADEIQLEL